jgi:hypothetical protein
VQRRDGALYERLAPVIRRLRDDPAWQRALQAYQ